MEFYLNLYLAAGFFLLGAAVGSFLNVVIARLPQGESIVSPRSRCPKCGTFIRCYDNIPILSFLFLRGRCRYCGCRISYRYPFVEFLTACLGLALFLKWGLTTAFLVYFLFTAAWLAVFWIDLDHMIIPNVISYPGMVLGLLFSAAGMVPGITWQLSLAGLLLGGIILYVPAVIYEKIRKVEGLGGGDIKLLAMMGTVTGPHGVVFILFASSLVGSLSGVVGMALRRTDLAARIPFGPFLVGAAVLYLLAGDKILNRFFQISRLL